MKFKEIIYNLLTEDQEGVYKKHFSDIERRTFIRIASADPRTKIVDDKIIRLGSYYTFLINMYRNGNLRFEDLPKATEYLGLIYKYQMKIGQMKINSIPDLYELVKDKIAKTKTTLATLIEALDPKEYEVKHNGDSWFVVVPKSEKAAAYLGVNTEWCTTWGDYCLNPEYKDRTNRFSSYSPQGPLYIIVNKENEDDKYQLHFPSNQLKNPADNEISNRPQFFNDRLEIKKLFFPELYSINNTKDEIKLAYSKVRKFLSQADIKIISDQLYDAYASDGENPIIKALADGDEETLQEILDFDDCKVTIIRDVVNFELRALPQSINDYDDFIRNLHSIKNGAYEHVSDSEYYYYKDEKYDIISRYLGVYYDENQRSLIEKFGNYLKTKENFINAFAEEIADDTTVGEKFVEAASEEAAASLENNVDVEINKWEGYLDITSRWSDYDVEIPVEHFISFLSDKEILSFVDVDTLFEQYIDHYDIPSDVYEYPEYDPGSPSNEFMSGVFDDYLEAIYEEKWGNKIGDEDVANECLEKKQKFLEIIKNHFRDDSTFENEFVKIKIDEPWMKNFDCEDGIKVKYENKKTFEKYVGYIQIDNLINHMQIEPLFERLSFKSILKDIN